MLRDNDNFFKSLKVEPSSEDHRILVLKKKYDNHEISEEDISIADKKKLIEMYNADSERLIRKMKKHKC